MVHVDDFLRIGRLRDTDLTAGTTPTESAAILRSRQAETGLRERLAHLEGKLAQADMVIETLREQLAAKDERAGQARRPVHPADQPAGPRLRAGRCGMSTLSKPGADPRPPVQRLCAGEALLLTDEEVT